MFYSIINPAKEISKVSYLIRKGYGGQGAYRQDPRSG